MLYNRTVDKLRGNIMKEQRYFMGDLAEYTGEFDGEFYEMVLLNGHLKGELRYTLDSPSSIHTIDQESEKEIAWKNHNNQERL